MAMVLRIEQAEPEPPSRYFHASLYKFNGDAAAAVKLQLHKFIPNGSVNCDYDPHLDQFQITCPMAAGGNADEMLGRIIKDYIEEELANAEQERRDPNVMRFPASNFEALDAFEPAHPPTPTAEGAGKPRRTHIVITSEREGALVRLFALKELRECEMLSRYLTPLRSNGSRRSPKGYVIRATRWSTKDGHVFNARTGESSSGRSVMRIKFELPMFGAWQDSRPASEILAPATWEFVPGDESTSVDKWLRGVGSVRQVEPLASRPEVPKDARMLLAAAETHAVGRARYPKGVEVVQRDLEESDSPGESSSDEDPDVSFQDLLPRAAGGGASSQKMITAAPLDRGKRPARIPAPKQPLRSQTNNASQDQRLLHSQDRADSSTQSSMAARQENASQFGQGWAYDKKYAKCDSIGLTANAAKTAEWYNKQPSIDPGSSRSNANRMNMDVAASNFSGTLWETKKVPAQVPHGNLVDISVPTSTKQVAPPPGLLPWRLETDKEETTGLSMGGLHIAEGSSAQKRRSNNPENAFPDTTKLPSLVNANEHRGKISSSSAGPEDVPLERIQSLPKDYAKKWDTMRQKSGRRRAKGASHKTPKGPQLKAELPLPSPPRPSKDKKKAHGTPPGHEVCVGSVHYGHLAPSTEITSLKHDFGALLEATRKQEDQRRDEDDEAEGTLGHVSSELVCQFGNFLSRPEDEAKALTHDAHKPLDLQARMRENTENIKTNFLPRLTTSLEDATYILSAAAHLRGVKTESPVSASAWFEFHIQDTTTRAMLKIMVPAGQDDSKEDFKVYSSDTVLGEACVHYPIHVWDAKFTLVKRGTDCEVPCHQAIADFVASLDTDQELTFRAMTQPDLFKVERVLCKRDISVQLENGLTATVVEITHMAIEELPGANHNLRALARSRGEMVTEQRVWWEASVTTKELDRADLLQECVHQMMGYMDCVGLRNEGLWEHKEDEQSKDNLVVAAPFW